MKDKIYIDKDKLIDSIYNDINKDKELTLNKKLIEEVIQSQSQFTTDKIHDGGFEVIIWKGMGKFVPNFNTLRKILKRKNNEQSN
jgi:hypothetical protein